MNLSQKLLMVAKTLFDQFSVEELIVECWRKWPATFGLKGYENQYPNSNVVIACLSHKHGPIRRGWLQKIRSKTYALTSLGKQFLKEIESKPISKVNRRLVPPIRILEESDGWHVMDEFEHQLPGGPWKSEQEAIRRFEEYKRLTG